MTKKMAHNREKMLAKLNVLKFILVIVHPFEMRAEKWFSRHFEALFFGISRHFA
jgi:hypothetical protein